jgi:hypothetical protein
LALLCRCDKPPQTAAVDMSNAHVEAIVADAKTFDYTAAAPLDVSGLAVSDLHYFRVKLGPSNLTRLFSRYCPGEGGKYMLLRITNPPKDNAVSSQEANSHAPKRIHPHKHPHKQHPHKQSLPFPPLLPQLLPPKNTKGSFLRLPHITICDARA